MTLMPMRLTLLLDYELKTRTTALSEPIANPLDFPMKTEGMFGHQIICLDQVTVAKVNLK